MQEIFSALPELFEAVQVKKSTGTKSLTLMIMMLTAT
jgi:hypothetical protein